MGRHVARSRPLARRLPAFFDVFLNIKAHLKEGWISACEVSARIAARLDMSPQVQAAMLTLFEHWDGKGDPYGVAGEDIPVTSRVVLPAFLLVPFHRVGGREAALRLARTQRGKAFDPAVVDAFEGLAKDETFWHEFEDAPILDLVLRMEPDTPGAVVTEERFDDVALAFADFIDLKSPYTATHSRRSAVIAERIAALMGSGEAERRQVKRTALIHDLGLVAVPSFYLNLPESKLSQSEREMIRLHPYHGERILERVGAMSSFTPAVGAHHERFDGSGFFRGLKGKDIPLAARIVAVADRLDELTHERPEQAALDVEQALKALVADSGSWFDPDIVYAVAGSLSGMPAQEPPAQWPAGLTDREVEVLRLAARGLTRKDVGKRLGITENTVRHHLEHIYNKTGCSTRVSATLFAMEHGLLE
jgi:HD-GYP domain-containing protein (c-di-GMP phosphodiesterase class II)